MKPILIVDDEAPIRALIRLTLERAGYTCDEAATGTEAADKIEANTYDLALLDIMLPGDDGLPEGDAGNSQAHPPGEPDQRQPGHAVGEPGHQGGEQLPQPGEPLVGDVEPARRHPLTLPRSGEQRG